MANMLLAAPNYVDDAFFDPIFGGGSWNTAFPIRDLAEEFYVKESRSSSASASDSVFEIDFRTPRSVGFVGVPDGNFSSSATIQIEGSNTIAWSGVTVDGVNAVNATSLDITTGSDAVAFVAGQIFTIAGDSTVYQITADNSVGASTSDSIDIKRVDIAGTGLVAATAGSEVITCHSGDYTSPVFDTGTVNYYPKLYPVSGVGLPWGDPRIWTGTFAEEDFTTLNFPRQFVKVLSQTYTIRYVRTSITDTGNSDGYVSVASFYVCPTYIPTYNMDYGLSFGLRSNSTKESSPGGIDAFDKQRAQRYINFTLSQTPLEEAFSSQYDLDLRLDVTGNLFFVYDSADDVLLFRRSFAGRFENLQAISPTFFDGAKKSYSIIERIA